MVVAADLSSGCGGRSSLSGASAMSAIFRASARPARQSSDVFLKNSSFKRKMQGHDALACWTCRSLQALDFVREGESLSFSPFEPTRQICMWIQGGLFQDFQVQGFSIKSSGSLELSYPAAGAVCAGHRQTLAGGDLCFTNDLQAISFLSFSLLLLLSSLRSARCVAPLEAAL